MGSHGGEDAKKKAMWLYPKVLGFNPSERWGHSACYSHGVVYVFGGCCGGLDFSDVLMLNLDTMVWNTLATTGQGPGPRDSHSAVLVGRQMIVFGGTNGSKKVNDLHILDLGTKEWINPECKGTPPSPRESHTATLIGDDRIMVFGGSGEGEANYLNDLHVLDLKSMRWTSPEVKGNIPAPRDSHSAVQIGNKLFVYGGDRGDRYHGDVDVLDTDTWTWTKLAVQGSSPGVRAGHASVNIGTKLYVIGGVGEKHYYIDVWVLDVSSCSWTQLDVSGQQPQGRFSHTAVVTDSDIVIYGGCREDERPLNQLLVLQPGAEHPSGRHNISMCKIFGQHWNQEKRRFLPGAEDISTMFPGNNEIVRKGSYESEESKQPFQFSSDTLHHKKRRTTNSKVWEIDLEQEEHSLSFSQHSSSSQSDQEQIPVQKSVDSLTSCKGLDFFRHINRIPRNYQADDAASNQKQLRPVVRKTRHSLQISREHKRDEQYVHGRFGRQGTPVPAIERGPMESGSIQNLVGAEVRGKVDGAFDAGLLMTATVNGKIFRGVLFSPAPGFVSRGAILAQNHASPATQIPIVHQFPNSNHIDSLKPSHHPTTFSVQESSHSFQQTQMSRTYPVIRSAPSLGKESNPRSDLQGVVLTLGGPASC
ncbi:acyl-CoA-binding domain-containing protein [Salix suchowensis]|nr:acyl-CoA-binding domain-containing protein [Salix suchowensis]